MGHGDGCRCSTADVLLLRPLQSEVSPFLITFRTFCMCHNKEVLRGVFFFSE